MTDRTVLASQVGLIVVMVMLTLMVALVARRLKFPYTLALVLAGLFLGAAPIFPHITLDPNVVLFLFLPALLFEGAWNTDVRALRNDWLPIFLLAVPGLLISLVVIAFVVQWGTGLPLLITFLLGAILSPTDAIAVLGLLRQLGVAKRLGAIIEGESLFNDGVGTMAFELVLAILLLSLHQPSELDGLSLPLVVLKVLDLLGGGIVIGVIVGFLVSRFVRFIEDPLFETTITFCVAYGVFIIATLAGSSGLLAVVCAGLTLGSYGRRVGLSEQTQETVDTVWEFIGYVANSLLFLLLGIEIGQTGLTSAFSVIFWAIVGVSLGRALMVYGLLPLYAAFVRWRERRWAAQGQHPQHTHTALASVPSSWYPLILFSGLRGALSLALVLSLPSALPHLETLRLAVYGVVLVTLLGQGVGLRIILPRWPTSTSSAA